eukprot:Sspe_Gene.18500::Locus_6639_Transcript_1_1_Confidence_1.000_Length_577::g.18500::m.18500
MLTNMAQPTALAIFVGTVLFPFITIPFLALSFVLHYAIQRHRSCKGLPATWVEREREFSEVITPDGVRLRIHLIRSASEDVKGVALLCCPLGQCGPSAFRPIMARYGDQYHWLTWDYRGLFESDEPTSLRRLAVHFHAEDAMLVLRTTFGPQATAALAIGHSMGVQVALEAAALY